MASIYLDYYHLSFSINSLHNSYGMYVYYVYLLIYIYKTYSILFLWIGVFLTVNKNVYKTFMY